MEEFMHDLGELKAKIILAGGGLGIVIVILLVTLREILKPLSSDELTYLLPVLVATMIVAVSSIVFVVLAFVPLVNSLYERIRVLEDLSQIAMEDDLAIVTRTADELQHNRAALEQTQQELETMRRTLEATQTFQPVSQDDSALATLNISSPSSSNDQVAARVNEIVEKIMGEIADRIVQTDALYEQLVEQRDRLQQDTSRRSSTKASAKTRPSTPQLRIQQQIYFMSLARAKSIHTTNQVPDFKSARHEFHIDAKSLKQHASELFAKWNIKSYHKVWQYNDERGEWEKLEFTEKMEKQE